MALETPLDERLRLAGRILHEARSLDGREDAAPASQRKQALVAWMLRGANLSIAKDGQQRRRVRLDPIEQLL